VLPLDLNPIENMWEYASEVYKEEIHFLDVEQLKAVILDKLKKIPLKYMVFLLK